MLLRAMFALSAIAIYLRGGLPLMRATCIACTGNALCLVGSWALDLANRRHFLQHTEATLRVQRYAWVARQDPVPETLLSSGQSSEEGGMLRMRHVGTAAAR